MKIVLSILLVGIISMLVTGCSKSNDNDPGPDISPQYKTYEGDLINPYSTVLENFYNDGYERVNGNVKFVGVKWISDMALLSNLKIIEGNLEIKDNPSLLSLDGLDELTTIGGFLSVANNFL